MNIIDILNEAWNAGFDAAFNNARSTITREATERVQRTDVQRIFAQRTAADMVVEIVEDWQPIETAPHDRLILVYAPGIPTMHLPSITCTCMWHEDAGFCVDELREPTHWMPLPEPPT